MDLSQSAGILFFLLALVGVLLQWDTVMEDIRALKARKEGDDSPAGKSPPSQP